MFKPRPNALVEVLEVCLYREYCIRSWEPRPIPLDRFGPRAETPNSDTITFKPLRSRRRRRADDPI